jgi:maleylpyruvate isomerase
MQILLHNYWRSSASYRVRIALGLKQLAWTYKSVHLVKDGGQQKSAAFRSLNPMAQVPTLEIIENDGSRKLLSQSLPIIEYLDERFPDIKLSPADPYLRARCRELAEIVNSGIQPLQNLTTTRRVTDLGGDEKAWVKHFMAPGLKAFADAAADIAGDFAVGNSPSIADLALQPQLFSAHRFGVDFSDLPLLVALEQRYASIPAFADAHPDKQPDANS